MKQHFGFVLVLLSVSIIGQGIALADKVVVFEATGKTWRPGQLISDDLLVSLAVG